MTFLELRGDVYVRRPFREYADRFAAPYRDDLALPADAVDTGFRRDGKSLWLAADRRWAFVGTPGSVEAWPRAVERLDCA